jgi:hypothetical protein
MISKIALEENAGGRRKRIHLVPRFDLGQQIQRAELHPCRWKNEAEDTYLIWRLANDVHHIVA